MNPRPPDEGRPDRSAPRSSGAPPNAEDASETRLIRRWRFRAAHSYGRSDWAADRNRETFGSLADPHEHVWAVVARLVGRPDPETGFLVPLEGLDEAWEALLATWDRRSVNDLLPRGASPSTETLARWLFDSFGPAVRNLGSSGRPVRLESVAVFEESDLGAEYPARLRAQHPSDTRCQ